MKMSEHKMFGFKMPKELWAYLKKQSIASDMSMTDILVSLIKRSKEKKEKRLTEEINSIK